VIRGAGDGALVGILCSWIPGELACREGARRGGNAISRTICSAVTSGNDNGSRLLENATTGDG
jgi:hypothetical protein